MPSDATPGSTDLSGQPSVALEDGLSAARDNSGGPHGLERSRRARLIGSRCSIHSGSRSAELDGVPVTDGLVFERGCQTSHLRSALPVYDFHHLGDGAVSPRLVNNNSAPIYNRREKYDILEEDMDLILIVLVLFLLFGGGGYWGYRRWR